MAASSRPLSWLAGVAAACIAVAVLGRGTLAQQQEPSLNLQFHGFTDSRGVTVLSPTIDLDKDFTDRTGLRLRFGVDAISAASDSCIRCHPNGASNQRSFVNGSLIRQFGDTSWSVGGELSKERFYTATTGLTSISRNFNEANTTVAGGYSFSYNQPVLHPSKFTESQIAQAGFVAVTQTLTRSTIAQVGYELATINGYQSNPYLRALVDGVRIVGVAPDERLRQSFTARLRQALPGNTYLEADYRRYVDDWDLSANTASLGLTREFSPRWLVTGTYRRHRQTGTNFYQPTYTGNPEFFTADFRLFPFSSDLYTGRVVFTPASRVLGLPPGTGLSLQYEFYSSTTGFEAATFSSGLRIPLPR